MWIGLAIFFSILTLGFTSLNLVFACDAYKRKENDMLFAFIISTLIIIILCAMAIRICLWDYTEHPRYEHIECTEYHVTEQISDKGDTTYVIKYKPL